MFTQWELFTSTVHPVDHVKIVAEGQEFRLNPHSAGIKFKRRNLKFVDVKFWRLKTIPAM